MATKNNVHANRSSSKYVAALPHVTLINSTQPFIKLLQKALQEQGYHTDVFAEGDGLLPSLSQTDILVMDIAVARQPKSSKFIKVPVILVLTQNSGDTLPPWLQARHVFLLPYPDSPEKFIKNLADYLSPRTPNFDLEPYNAEHLALLFGITQFLSGHLDINDLFGRILDLAPYLDAEFAALLVLEGTEVIYFRSTQPGREELIGTAGRRFAQRLLEDGLEGVVLKNPAPIVIASTANDSRWLRASYLPNENHSIVALPFHLDRVEAKGVFLVGHKAPNYFTQNHLPLLNAAMTQIGMAIENAMLFKNQSQRSVQLSLINEVSQAATSILNLNLMLRTVVQAIRRSFAFYSVAIYLYNPVTNLVELQAETASDRHRPPTPGETDSPQTIELEQGLIGWAAATNKTVLANDVTHDARFQPSNAHREIRAELCVPIVMGKKTIGVLDLQSTQLEAFDNYHVSALETLADQLAIAIENARLYDEINRHLQELQSLNEIGQAITSTLDLQETLTLITDRTIRLMNVAAASVALRDDEHGDVWFAAASGEGSEAVIGLRMAWGQGIAGWVVEQGQPVMVPDVDVDARFFADMDKKSGFTTKSILCVPLKTKGRTIGAVEVMNKRNGTFNNDDLQLLQALASPAATAIENAQLYEEQTRTIKRLAETQSQLVQSGKLAAVGELAAGVAHEINNPLTTILGLTSLQLESLPETETPDSEETREDLQMIYSEAQRARNIVRNLLNFARTDTPKRQPTDFNQLVDEAISLVYTKTISQKVKLEKSLNPLPEMYLDVNQIKQVLVNLINNAVYAMQDNTNGSAILSVTTALQSMDTANNNKKASRSKEKIAICTISDTGKGIKAEHLDKIFDPFFTTKEVGQGTGLGLSISYGIIEKHGGNISVKSTEGQGSSFSLNLPISTTQPAEENPEKKQAIAP